MCVELSKHTDQTSLDDIENPKVFHYFICIILYYIILIPLLKELHCRNTYA